MAITLEQFEQAIVECGLMTADELHQFRAANSENESLVAESLAEVLLAGQRLTRYQATRILAGQHRGLVLGNYVILEIIGKGGMGEVFKAEHRRMKRLVAVKVLPPSTTGSNQAVRRFQREVEAAAKMVHPNIVTAFDADESDGIHFLVMEYVDGLDLSSLLAKQGPFSVSVAIDCMLQAARGLEYAHSRGMIHRDIKPGNLLLDSQGNVKILDMGLVRFAGTAATEEERNGDRLTGIGQIVGTVEYLSPEQAEDSSMVDHRSDIYSLGCTLYRLLTGRLPFGGDSAIQRLMAHRIAPIPSLRAARADVPEQLDAIFQRMMAKRREDRFQSATELIDELQSLLDGPLSNAPDAPPLVGSDLASTLLLKIPSELIDGNQVRAPDSREATVGLQSGVDTTSYVSEAASKKTHSSHRHPAVGIDLGTTYSAIARLDDMGRPQTILNVEGDKTTPSVILFEDDEIVIGKEAVKAMAGEMEQIAESPKRELGCYMFEKVLCGRQYPPEALQALILNKLRFDAAQQIGPFDKVVITVPAYFDEIRRKATQDAGYMAGLDVLDIINEPTAAAVTYGFRQGLLDGKEAAAESKKILVYDLGGGTFDVTIVEIDGARFSALATDGDVDLGGRDWDRRLIDYVAERFVEQHALDPRDDPNTLGRLWRECEDTKHTLSVRRKTSIACDYRGQAMRVEITRQHFEEITCDLLDRTSFTVRELVATAGLAWNDIERVLLVGGSSRMPQVGEMIQQLTGINPDRSMSPDEAVAHGAALRAGLLLDRQGDLPPRFAIKNVNSHSLGVIATDSKSKRRRNAVVIPRNTPLPASAKRVFRTKKTGQKSIRVKIVEGESALPEACSHIGTCVVRDLPPDLPARTPIEVEFCYESNGRLRVMVETAGMRREISHLIARDNALTRDQIESWRHFITGQSPANDEVFDATDQRAAK